MVKTLLLATNNPNKIREIKEILGNLNIDFKLPRNVNYSQEITENGKTYQENALIKAKILGDYSGFLTLAEDSGLEVDVLSGQPGIYSARYCKGTDDDRIDKLLHELEGVEKAKRTARFKATAVLYDPLKKKDYCFEGVSEGYITDERMGNSGFGYDPVFFNLDLGKTNGEATPEEKNSVSHRARALKKVKEFLDNS